MCRAKDFDFGPLMSNERGYINTPQWVQNFAEDAHLYYFDRALSWWYHNLPLTLRHLQRPIPGMSKLRYSGYCSSSTSGCD
jgi:hypothetical protein